MSNQDYYKESGVDVKKGEELVEWLQQDPKETGQLGSPVEGIGGFAGLFRPDFSGMKDPLLVSGTDGVGTKILLGLETGELHGLGIDLVAMCVNDLYTIGARPMFFLDYYATGVLDDKQFKEVLGGIKDGLRQSNCALMGGETAELPGLYQKGHFDLGGFVVGAVDKEQMLSADRVKVGDRLIALEASGFHSNGYSLVRKWVEEAKIKGEETLRRLMTPTKIYSEVPELLKKFGPNKFHALSNITGGGISGNLCRVLPSCVTAVIDPKKIETPQWMKDFILSRTAELLDVEGVFNLGVGMIAVVDVAIEEEFCEMAKKLDLKAYSIGEVTDGQGKSVIFK